jgi:hypothetical protein
VTAVRLLMVCALVACGGPRDPVATPPGPIAAPVIADAAPPADAAAIALADAAVADPARIELTFVGDLMFGGYFDDHYDPQFVEKHDPLVDVDHLLASDLAFGNLETTITRALPNKGGPHDGKGHKRFVTLPERVAVLARHHLKTVSLANNHQLDNDAKGLAETVEILGELGIAYVGASRAEQPAVRVETIAVKGWRVGFINASQQMNRGVPKGSIVPYLGDPAKLRAAIIPLVEGARRDHDLVFVVVHWGYEYQDVPARWQIDTARAFVDAGADAVIGHHPHVLQAIERYKDGVIAYSLGNFVFPNGKERIRETGVLRLGFAPGPPVARSRQAPPVDAPEPGVRACTDLVVFHPAIQIRQPITHPVIPTKTQRDAMAKRLFGLSGAKPFSTTWKLEGERFVAAPACP